MAVSMTPNSKLRCLGTPPLAQERAMQMINSRNDALKLDACDPLAGLKSRFIIPGGTTYLVGHSLGPATQSASEALSRAQAHWQTDIVRAWNSAGWIDLASNVGRQIAPLIGAKPEDIVVSDSVSVNLFKLAGAALNLVSSKRIIIEADEFPTDQYIATGLAELSGAELVKVPSIDGAKAVKGGGVLIKSLVNYRTGDIANAAQIEGSINPAKSIIIWDMSHATGIIPIDVKSANIRLAAGCTYKYLNGGPGAPAFIYARGDICEELISPLPGWLGHKSPFEFSGEYEPADHARRFIAGTPSILSLAALRGALEAYADVTPGQLSEKLCRQTELIRQRGLAMGLGSTSPENPFKRGGHISLIHDEGYAVVQALAARGIMADFRTPNIIRIGVHPLYISYADVWDVMEALEDILKARAWDTPEFKTRAKVT